MNRTLEDKLIGLDRHMDGAIDEIISLLEAERECIKRLAAGRHIWGHYRFGDRLMYEFDQGELAANEMEELADAVVYHCRRRQLDRCEPP